MTGRRVVAIVFGVLGVLVGAALIAGASTILIEDRDADGFYVTEEYTFERSSHAIVYEDVDILSDAPSWLVDRVTDPVDLRIQATSVGGEGLFMGIAATADADQYLSGVAYDEVTSLDVDGSTIASVEYQSHPGTAVPMAPGGEGFWAASIEGAGPQTLDWSLESGSWTVVVMNADASAGVDADLIFGAKISNIVVVAWIVMAIGLISVLGGGYLMYRGFRRSGEAAGTTRVVDLREEAAADVETEPVEERPAAKS
jgi:hypothetical protein